MTEPLVHLLTFPGCPHRDAAELAVAAAIEQAEAPFEVQRIDLSSLEPGSPLSRFPSPTVLVGGVDVSGDSVATRGLSCRAAGAPTADVILRRIAVYGPALGEA